MASADSLEVMLGYIRGQVGISCLSYMRADLQPIPAGSISPFFFFFFSVEMEFFLDESINSIAHTLQTCALRVIPLEMFEHGVERAAVSPLLGAGWPQNVWDWRCASPAPPNSYPSCSRSSNWWFNSISKQDLDKLLLECKLFDVTIYRALLKVVVLWPFLFCAQN